MQQYKERRDVYSEQLASLNRTRNILTILKLVFFAALVWAVVALVNGNMNLFYKIGAVSLAGFVILTIIDTRIMTRRRFLEQLIACLNTEISYLQGDFTDLDNGIRYASGQHQYASDLDIFGDDSLFRRINRTVTGHGTDLLSVWLSEPCQSRDEILQRQQATADLATDSDWAHRFRAVGAIYPTKDADAQLIETWAAEHDFLKTKQLLYVIYAFNLIAIVSWILFACSVISYALPLLVSLLQLSVVIVKIKKVNRIHQRLGRFMQSISNYLPFVRLIHDRKFTSERMLQLQKQLCDGDNNALYAFGRLNKIMEGLDQRSNIIVNIALNALYMRDFHLLHKLDTWRNEYKSHLKRWVDAITEFDVLVSMANYRVNHPHYIDPTLGEQVILRARDLGHPFIDSNIMVSNDLDVEKLHNIFIVTGANMAGKSTFLRSVGVNLVLALSGNVVCAAEFECMPMRLFTSMRTTDNLTKGTSYFHAELLRLKALIDTAQESERLFVILDEMLKGTNSHDKLNGSLKFLVKLLEYPISGLVASHDLALGELAVEYPTNFTNVCFEIEHVGDDISYDYKLKPGVSRNMNASILLKQMGLI